MKILFLPVYVLTKKHLAEITKEAKQEVRDEMKAVAKERDELKIQLNYLAKKAGIKIRANNKNFIIGLDIAKNTLEELKRQVKNV